MADVLAPGGLWVIKVPSTEGLYYRLSAMLARVAPRIGATFMRRLWQTDYEFPHTVYFDRPSLQRWLRRHGFSPGRLQVPAGGADPHASSTA